MFPVFRSQKKSSTHQTRSQWSFWRMCKLLVIALLVCWFLLLMLISRTQAVAVAQTQTLGYGGGAETLLSQSQATVMQSVDVSPLPAPVPTSQSQPSIEPQTPLPEPPSSSSSSSSSSTSSTSDANWLGSALTGLWQQFTSWVIGFCQQVIDWASSFGFLYITPSVLTYKNAMVVSGETWALTAMDGLVAILLVVAGYQVMSYRYLDLQEQSLMGSALRIALGAVAANLGYYVVLPQLIETSNQIGLSFLGWMLGSVNGPLSFPLGAINLTHVGLGWSLFVVIDFVISLLFVFVELVRIALLDVCIILAPFWVVLLSNEWTRAWGRLGATTFFSALLVQPLQMIIVGFGSALIANFGAINPDDPSICSNLSALAKHTCQANIGNASVSASMTPITLLVGIAALYVAMKVPGMLFSQAVRASIGSVNRDVASVAKSAINGAMSVVMFNRTLSK